MNGGWSQIWADVEQFRLEHLGSQCTALPVDVFTIVELKLRLDVIPFDDLAAKYQIDAALTQDFRGMYVDAESYIVWEKGPVWKQNRLRFTVAHELGHFVLHREQASKLKFSSFDQFAAHFKGSGGPRYTIEQEANEFAGRLLVPIERLRACYDEFAAKASTICQTGVSRMISAPSLPRAQDRDSASTHRASSLALTAKISGPPASQIPIPADP